MEYGVFGYGQIKSFSSFLKLHCRFRRLPAHPATINSQDVTADIGTRLAGQIHGGALKVIRRTPSPGGDSRADAGQSLRVVEQRRVHLRLNVARRNRIHRDALGRPLVGKALGHLTHGALGRGVRRHGETALEAEQRAKVDDAAAAAGDWRGFEAEDVRANVPAEREYGVEVDLHDLRSC